MIDHLHNMLLYKGEIYPEMINKKDLYVKTYRPLVRVKLLDLEKPRKNNGL